MPLTVVWFRQDLRIYDHEPLYRAACRGQVIPIYIFERSLLALDSLQAINLRTWLVAHVEIQPHKSTSPKSKKEQSQNKSSKTKKKAPKHSKEETKAVQLSLF